MDYKILGVGWLLGIVSSCLAILLQAYIHRKQAHTQSLLDRRLSVYSKLMFAVMAEERYPGDFFPRDPYNLTEERKEYNLKVVQWRKNRREIKGLASEALLLSSNSKLREKLLNFMQNDNPEFKLTDIEKLMKEEIKSE